MVLNVRKLFIVQTSHKKTYLQVNIENAMILNQLVREHIIESPSEYDVIKNSEYSENSNQIRYLISIINQLKDVDVLCLVKDSKGTSPEYRIVKHICMEYGLPFYEMI